MIEALLDMLKKESIILFFIFLMLFLQLYYLMF